MDILSDMLVLGYGNPLRRDDAAGCLVAEKILSLDHNNIDAVSAHQLLPEHAELIRRYRRVFFVDASADKTLNEIRVTHLSATKTDMDSLHACDPESILSLCKSLYDSSPDATFIAIPARNFDFGDTLSPVTERSVMHAVNYIMNHRFGM
jgi:hydrogenase maturation protease